MAGCVCFFVVLALLPSKIYSIMNGPNEYAISRAGFVETEMYGLKIIMLFRPLSTHGISLFEKAIDIYDSDCRILYTYVCALYEQGVSFKEKTWTVIRT